MARLSIFITRVVLKGTLYLKNSVETAQVFVPFHFIPGIL